MKTNSKKIINIGVVVRNLKNNRAQRAKLEAIQNNLWKQVKRGHSRREELNSVSKQIGNCTNEIQKCISKLLNANWHWDYSTKQEAIEFLSNEIARKQRIVASWSKTIRDVDAGRATLINGSGITHTNTANAKDYVKNCKAQIARNQKLIAKIRNA